MHFPSDYGYCNSADLVPPAFRYDLDRFNGCRVILIEDVYGKRSAAPLLGTVVLPSATQRRG